MHIAVVGSGIAGLSAAWLLSQRHHVTLYEAETRPGGHSNTVNAAGVPVDTGFIVYNEVTYPNLTALFTHLGVKTNASDMSFSVSLQDGRVEYAGTNLAGLFAQPTNLVRPRFWSMLRDLSRFYRQAPAAALSPDTTLGAYLDAQGYGEAFQNDHLLPMAAAIWSAPASALRDCPALHFIRFCENHGLLKFSNRPVWRSVAGGSREYVHRLLQDIPDLQTGHAIRFVHRRRNDVVLTDITGDSRHFDHVVLACHADQALRALDRPTPQETRLLGAIRYTPNRAVLHSDRRFMPRRRTVWASWNYLGGGDLVHVTYWMNRLQVLKDAPPLFVTLNPDRDPDLMQYETIYEHPVFDTGAMRARQRLWSLQGQQRTWFCGAYFGAGFHEDGLQSGLAVAEQLGGVRRPWSVANESGRIVISPDLAA